MKLGTKLFLFVGALLLVICVAIYFVPIYVAKKQAEIDSAAYLARQEVRHAKNWERQMNWLVGEVSSRESLIDAFLYFTASNPSIHPVLAGGETRGGIWLPAIQLLNYSNIIDFIQVSQDPNGVAAMGVSDRYHYWSYEEPVDDKFSWVVADSRYWQHPLGSARPEYDRGELIQYSMIGVRLPNLTPVQTSSIVLDALDEPDNVRLLFNPIDLYRKPDSYSKLLEENLDQIRAVSFPRIPEAGKAMEELLNRLVEVQAYLAKTFKSESDLKAFMQGLQQKSAHVKTEIPLERDAASLEIQAEGKAATEVARQEIWARYLEQRMRGHVLDMATAMAYYASLGVVWKTPLDPGAAVGAAYIVPGKGQGGTVFAVDLFSTKRIFDELKLIDEFPPIAEDLPISSGFALVSRPPFDKPSMANALELVAGEPISSQGYLSVGISTEPILRHFHTLTGEKSLLIANNRVVSWAGFSDADLSQEMGEVSAIQEELPRLTGNTGFVTLEGIRYYYSRYKPQEEWNLEFLTLAPAGEVEASYALFQKRSAARMEKISLQLLIVAVVVFVIALFILQLLARHFTKPLSQLAQATADVAKGHYERVRIPKVSKTSKNEITMLTGDFGKMVDGLSDKSKIRAVLDKVVSKEIAEEILNGKVELGGEVKEACVLFADIRNFTHLSEKLTPQETITFINGFMNRMARVIETYQGVIDKYVGDAIMAIYGAPVRHKYSQLQAVISAILMIESLHAWNKEREAAGQFPITAGIGISYGEMVAGNVGAEDRLNYTVIGEHAELAQSLSDVALPMEILVPEVLVNMHQIRTFIEVEDKGNGVFRVLGLKAGHSLEEISKLVTEG